MLATRDEVERVVDRCVSAEVADIRRAVFALDTAVGELATRAEVNAVPPEDQETGGDVGGSSGGSSGGGVVRTGPWSEVATKDDIDELRAALIGPPEEDQCMYMCP
jgi:hypothetical protein